MSNADHATVRKQRGFRDRNRDKPVLSVLPEKYAEWYLEFCPTGDATRSDLAAAFVEHAREAAERYAETERYSRPVGWETWRRDPKSRAWMREHKAHRRAWAKAIDLLWEFSEGEQVDADALREALVRESIRRHWQGTRRARHEESAFCKAARLVREMADLDRMAEVRREAVHEDYR